MSGLKNNEILASITWTAGEGGPPLTITMGLTNTSSATASDINTLWQDSVMFSNTSTLHPDNLDTDYSFANFKVLLMRGGVLTSDEIIDTTAGGLDEHTVPVRNCLNMKKVTGLAARKYRGRCFLPGAYLPNQNVTEAGAILDDVLTDIQASLLVWYNRLFTSNSLHPAILHLKTAEAATPVNSFHCQQFLGTIRHRQQRN